MNQDKKMIAACLQANLDNLFPNGCLDYPLDSDIRRDLKRLKDRLRDEDDNYQLFRYRDDIDKLWGLLLEKAIKCLRYFDSREPFLDSGDRNKRPIAYGIDELKKYYGKYTEFERVLYGSGRYYRDHVVHVMRTWLSGVELLVRNDGDALQQMGIHDKKVPLELKHEEKLSIWTIIALTHDLGYPLEKAKSIIDVTQDMLGSFIANPDISVDFSFHGVQNYMNDYIVRLMSSKMEKRSSDVGETDGKEGAQKERYVARLQSKYYFKFQKSLEHNKHGILSTLIIYKLLTYFLESDYNLNEDYYFNEEDCRQFYIRREILRAIASHTCNDIYQMYMGSFSFLLRICDDTQEWGRKNLSELYVKSNQTYELERIALDFGEGQDEENCCTIQETVTVQDLENTVSLVQRFRRDALTYVMIFRDGQDTSSRDFSFTRKLSIKVAAKDISVALTLDVDRTKASRLSGQVTYAADQGNNMAFGPEFYEKLSKNCEWYINNSRGDRIRSSNSKGGEAKKSRDTNEWHLGYFVIPLIN